MHGAHSWVSHERHTSLLASSENRVCRSDQRCRSHRKNNRRAMSNLLNARTPGLCSDRDNGEVKNHAAYEGVPGVVFLPDRACSIGCYWQRCRLTEGGRRPTTRRSSTICGTGCFRSERCQVLPRPEQPQRFHHSPASQLRREIGRLDNLSECTPRKGIR